MGIKLKNMPDPIGKWLIENAKKVEQTESGCYYHYVEVCRLLQLMKEQCDGKADSTSEKDLRVCEVIPRFFDPERNKPLPSKNDITFSDDVFIIDEDGMHGLAYYSFEDCQWKFHTDTLVDYNEIGHETKWKWYYPTFTVKDAF